MFISFLRLVHSPLKHLDGGFVKFDLMNFISGLDSDDITSGRLCNRRRDNII